MIEEKYHVFHFIGHGGFDAKKRDEGGLILEDGKGNGIWTGAERIGTLLHDQRSLRLALLNVCEGAMNSIKDPFSGVATTLIQKGIPAVVAMQFEISDNAATAFSEEFYETLTDGFPVDAAVSEARKAVYDINDIEWGTPVLYMRCKDGNLFISEKNDDWRKRNLFKSEEYGGDWRKRILWVDDRPENNVYERKTFEKIGLTFTLALSTNQALEILKYNNFGAIISG